MADEDKPGLARRLFPTAYKAKEGGAAAAAKAQAAAAKAQAKARRAAEIARSKEERARVKQQAKEYAAQKKAQVKDAAIAAKNKGKEYATQKAKAAATSAVNVGSMSVGDAAGKGWGVLKGGAGAGGKVLGKGWGISKVAGKLGWGVAGGAAGFLFGKSVGGAKKVYHNLSMIGLVGLMVLAIHAYNLISGYTNYSFRFFAAMFVLFLFLLIGVPIGYAFIIAIFDFLVPSFLVNIVVLQNPPGYFFFLTPFVNLLPDFVGTSAQSALMVVIVAFAPALVFLFFVMNVDLADKSVLYRTIRAVYMIIIFLAIASFTFATMALGGLDAADPIAHIIAMSPEGRELGIQAGKAVIDFPNTAADWTRGLFQTAVRVGTGGELYASEVEQTQSKPIGVAFKNIAPADPIVWENQETDVWGDLEVLTFEEEMKTIDLSCYADTTEADKKVPGTASPKSVNIELKGTEAVQCRFPDGLEKGTRRVTFTADFEFFTKASIRAYFIDRAELLSLSDANIDPYTRYPVPEPRPSTKYSSGPVEIGIGATSPIAISSSAQTPMPRLGFSIAPKWNQGELANIKKVIVYVPNGIELETSSCNHDFNSANIPKDSDDYIEGYKPYELGDLNKINNVIDEYEHLSFSCRLSSQNSAKVLEDERGTNVGLAQKYFFVTAEYDFKLEETKNIQVKADGSTAIS